MVHYKAIFCALGIFTSMLSWANESDYHLKINTEIMVPYNFYDENNELIGLNIDIVKQVLAKANISAEFSLLPWVRSYQTTLKVDNAGLMSTARTAEREQLFKWVGPLASGKGYLYQLKSRQDIQVSSLVDAKNYLVAVVRGDVYQNMFENLGFEHNKNLILFSYNAEYVKPFLAGKVDLILGSDIVLPYMLAASGSTIDQVKAVAKIPDTKGNYLALNKNVPDEVVLKLNQVLSDFKTTAEYEKLVNKYKLMP